MLLKGNYFVRNLLTATKLVDSYLLFGYSCSKGMVISNTPYVCVLVEKLMENQGTE
jgi:hypothetical protein